VQKYSGVEFIKDSFAQISSDDLDIDYKPKRISKNNTNYQPDAPLVAPAHQKLVSQHINFQKAKELDLKAIPWTKISSKIKTKSKDDCRNRW
jgi:hypothetical protein